MSSAEKKPSAARGHSPGRPRPCRARRRLPFVLCVLSVLCLPPSHAQDNTLTLDDLMDSADQWAKQNLDDDALRALQEIDRERVKQFFRELATQFHNEDVVDLGALNDTARRCCRCWNATKRRRPTPPGSRRGWRTSRSPTNSAAPCLCRLPSPGSLPNAHQTRLRQSSARFGSSGSRPGPGPGRPSPSSLASSRSSPSKRFPLISSGLRRSNPISMSGRAARPGPQACSSSCPPRRNATACEPRCPISGCSPRIAPWPRPIPQAPPRRIQGLAPGARRLQCRRRHRPEAPGT